MKKIIQLGTFLFLFTVLFANTLSAQGTFTWNGSTSSSWATSTNWTKTGLATTSTYPGQSSSTDIVVINNNGAPNAPIFTGTLTIATLTVSNNASNPEGAKLTIASGALSVISSNTTVVILSGGSIENNGTLNIRSTATAASFGLQCTTPATLPIIEREYGYSGNGILNINISTSTGANASTVNINSLNLNTTYKMLFNSATTTFNLGTSATNATFALRTLGGANMSPVIIGGTGFTISGVNGGLLNIGNQSNLTINSGTTLTMNSAATNVSPGITLANTSTTVTTNFTNNGTINISGESLNSGISAGVTGSTGNLTVRINIANAGTINVDLACLTPSVANSGTFSWSGHAAYQQRQASVSNTTGVVFTNDGTLTLRNRSTVDLTGYAIWGSGAGQRMPTSFVNNGTLTIDGSVNSIAQGFTLNNYGTVNSNNTINFTALNNYSGGSVNFIKTPVIFTVLSTAAATEGSTYQDGNLNVYTISTTKLNGTGLKILATTNPIATIPSGTSSLTLLSGTGDATIEYTAFTATLPVAVSVTTVNSGTINTAQGRGLILSNITSTTFTTDATSVLDPGGSSGKGIMNIARAATTILGKIKLQVSGNNTAGVDYDQIINSATGGGFDISGATLEISSLYTPTTSVSIPIITTSGSGTISGPFASVTGLTSGWTISYDSPTSVNLVYTYVVIPTIWTGVANNDFFNEANWRDSVTNAVPDANTINPGTDINLHLQINSAVATITSGVIQFGAGSLTIGAANLTATSLSGGTVTINAEGYVTLSSAAPLLTNVQINLNSGIGWIKTTNYNPTAVSTNNLAQIKVNNSPAFYSTNLRLDNYYFNGCVIRANLTSATPLTVYDSTNFGGTSAAITVNTIHSNTAIANSMNNKIESFLLKKGFMVTFANEIDGTGKSINYIASEADLVINTLPTTLQNSISFIRVMPWNWVTKKGRTDIGTDLNTSWVYKWNNTLNTTLDWEYAPMSWGNGGADDATDIALYAGKYNSTHVMSFNEPDDCNGQSGQYGNLCQTDVAVSLHKNLMKTGMRIVSPGGREEAPFSWLEEFYTKAKAQDVRIDVIAVHWYDWGSNPVANPNHTGLQVFNRFKAYLTNVYNLYGLPIWITEFNANPARSSQVNADFLALALPYLESLHYVERYNWFPYNSTTHFSGWDDVTDTQTDAILNAVGTIYKNINNSTPVNSTPSIPESTISDGNNLDLNEFPNVALNKPATASSNLTNLGPSKAVDGDKTTSTSRWVVELATLPAWIEINLQNSFLVNSFRITEDVNTVKNFRFEVWDATLNSGAGGWVSALTVVNNPATPPLVTYRTITPVNTTKVRLYVTGHNAADRMRIFELEVFGTPSSPVWTGTTNTSWTTAANWSTSAVPNQFSNVTIASGTPFQPTISTSQSVKTLIIDAGATLTVNSGINLTVENAIINNGTMTLSNNANLLQGDAFNNSGNINVNRNSNLLSRLDYTIWSSPVTNPNQFLTTFSSETSLNRFYSYNQSSNVYNGIATPSTTPFALATGYLIRMPNTAVTAPSTQTFTGIFNGVPNNGNITKTVSYNGASFGYNLIGNPYPSTLDADAFITANASKIESSLWFWRKTNAASGTAYAVYNALGSTKTPSSPTPSGDIQVGQGFFVKAKNQSDPTRYFVTFNNAMRLGTGSTQFFKTKQVEKDRIWLNLTNTSGAFNQILIGYVEGASLGVDNFDSKYINDSPIALTSNINGEEYTIQGRPKFDTKDVVTLNFKTNVDGEYTIALDHFDGVFANGQDIYLLDSKTGVETDLKAGAYNFTATAGNDNSRFSLKYQKTLKVDAPVFNENNVRIYKNNGTLSVNSEIVAIDYIKVYDIQGRLVAEQNNIKAMTAILKDLKFLNQVLIVKVTGEDNSVVSKKIVN